MLSFLRAVGSNILGLGKVSYILYGIAFLYIDVWHLSIESSVINSRLDEQ